MKILIATGIFPPQIGGPATYSKLLFEEFPQRGLSVAVVNFGSYLKLPKIIRHLVYFLNILLSGLFVDIIYAQDPVSVGLPAMIASKILRKGFYLKVVGDYAWEQELVERRNLNEESLEEFQHKKYGVKTEIRKKIERSVARGARRIIVPSEYLKKIVSLWGVPEEKIVVIYNGFNPPSLNEDKEAIRKRLGMKGWCILSIGRLVPWKGFVLLIETMPNLLKRNSDASLFIAGDGPDRGLLEKKIIEFGLEDNVFLLGKLSQEELFEYIKASDVFVLNTAYEGFSHQILEVMALGVPVITTSRGGNVEIIHDHKNGILVPYNDSVLLEKAVEDLRTDNELRNNIIKNAQEKVKEFSNERMLESLVREIV
ncbi:MAG: glycosyltransferase family 4 protein [Candidatus Yonathbacteria bacterium]|nr:glycosyltransferase family 4 protein [Candidatus Yonathbacteria bacterium]